MGIEGMPASTALAHWLTYRKLRLLGTILALMGVIAPVAIGFAVGLVTDFGRRTDPRFFELIAQIIPVFFIAMFVEYLSPAGHAQKARTLTAVAVGDVLIGEALSLYAVAANTATTFLTVTCSLALFVQVLDLAALHAARERYPAKRQEAAPPIVVKVDERGFDFGGPEPVSFDDLRRIIDALQGRSPASSSEPPPDAR